jgi:hypothetical protein
VLGRRASGIALIVGPALAVVGTALHPARRPEEAEHLASVAANLDRWYLAHLLFVVALGLAIPGILAIVRLVGARRPRWAQVGGALAFAGLIAVTPVISWEFVVWEMAKPGRDTAEMTALLERLNSSPGLLVFGVASVAFPVGFVVLSLGLRLARAVPAWQAAALGIGYVVFFVGGLATTSVVVPLVGALGILAGSAAVGVRLLTERDEHAAAGALAAT